ncbi:MAG TPA: gluconeogenesis factor YvcK family protein [Anaerolineaceae bacterium]|nr:gluconeogenesis factor YvcK family protein [Anaerolineaceae bacterium]
MNFSLARWIRKNARWLTPGIGVKRWVLVLLLGVTLLGVGLALFVLDIYRTVPDTWWLPYLSTASLRFLDRPMRILIFGGIGLVITLLGIWGLSRALLKPFMRPGWNVIDTMTTYRRRERGPRIVTIGGGTGLSTLLRGLKEHTHNLTAIVTVSDDGGSSGELRRNIGILPPGDIRSCLAALSDDEAMMTQIFQYRFGEGAGLNGHSLGNLLITALTDITGSFEEAVTESGRVLAVHGQVVPATLHDVRLVADVILPDAVHEVQVKGESSIPKAAGHVRNIWLEPNNPLAFPPAIQAILAADLIVIGPGSLYTSIIPNLLVPDIAEALRVSRAMKFYVCNVTTQPGETDGYSCDDHVRVIEKHLGSEVLDVVISNKQCVGNPPAQTQWVKANTDQGERFPIYEADLLDLDQPRRHHSGRLAQTVLDLFYERTGPLAG